MRFSGPFAGTTVQLNWEQRHMTVYMGFKRAMITMQIKGSRLVKTFTNVTPLGYVYHVIPGQPGGKTGQVTEDVAEKIKQHPQVSDLNDGLFPGRSQTWVFY